MTAPHRSPVLTLTEADDLAGRLTDRIAHEVKAYQRLVPDSLMVRQRQADLERVEADLAGLRRHAPGKLLDPVDCICQKDGLTLWPCPDGRAYAAGLLRTAELYDVPR